MAGKGVEGRGTGWDGGWGGDACLQPQDLSCVPRTHTWKAIPARHLSPPLTQRATHSPPRPNILFLKFREGKKQEEEGSLE